MALAQQAQSQCVSPTKNLSKKRNLTLLVWLQSSAVFAFNLRYINITNNYHYQCASGFYVDLIRELSNKLQFTFDIYEAADKTWGTQNKLGEWNGVIKELMSKKADLAMTPITITTSRTEVVDFSVPFMETVKTKI